MLGAAIELGLGVMSNANHPCDIELIVLHINSDKVFTSLVDFLVTTTHSITKVERESSSIREFGHEECPEVLDTVGLSCPAHINDHVARFTLVCTALVFLALELEVTS